MDVSRVPVPKDKNDDKRDEIGIVADLMRTTMRRLTGQVSIPVSMANGFRLLIPVLCPAFMQLACLFFFFFSSPLLKSDRR